MQLPLLQLVKDDGQKTSQSAGGGGQLQQPVQIDARSVCSLVGDQIVGSEAEYRFGRQNGELSNEMMAIVMVYVHNRNG